MSASADFELSSDGGSNYEASNASLADADLLAYASSGTYSIKARLTSTADVVAVQWTITTADDEHLSSLPTVTSNADKTCSFSVPKTGGAWILKATVTDGSGTIRTNTLAIKVAAQTGAELIAAGEGTETGEAGWIRCFNDVARGSSGSFGPARPDLSATDLVRFKLDDAAGTTTISNTGNGTAFSLDTPTGAGSLTFGIPQPFGDAALIVGTRYITGTGGQSYQPSVTNFTASCWVQFKKSPALGGANFVSLFGKINTTDSTFSLGFDQNLGEFKCKVGAGGTDTTSTGQPLMVGERHHLVMTYDGADIKLYQNGALLQTTAKTGTLDWSNAHNWVVGNAGAASSIFTLSECKYNSAVLTLAQIKAECYQGHGWSS